MSVNTETAQERLRLADRFLDQEDVAEALIHIDKAQQLLLREPHKVKRVQIDVTVERRRHDENLPTKSLVRV